MTQIFSGLTLMPGTYYLSLASSGFSSSNIWNAPVSPAIDLAPGVSLGGAYVANDILGSQNTAYPPASSFVQITELMNFRVESAPGPAAFLLLFSGVSAIVLFKRYIFS
jgi:hypothetical protein